MRGHHCFTDYDRHIALVADHESASGCHEIAAVGRLIKLHGLKEAEFSLIVSDPWQQRGLGGKMLDLLIQVARAEKRDRIIGQVFNDNRAMLSVCQKAGFRLIPGDETRVEMNLSGNP